MAELKPCPFCGCSRILVSQRNGVPLVTCYECWGGNRTVEAWNRRVEPTNTYELELLIARVADLEKDRDQWRKRVEMEDAEIMGIIGVNDRG